jgi:hypothetical protein
MCSTITPLFVKAGQNALAFAGKALFLRWVFAFAFAGKGCSIRYHLLVDIAAFVACAGIIASQLRAGGGFVYGIF